MASPQESGGLRSPDTVDRVLVIGCAVIWLAVIGVGVAATVALVDLGTGRQPEAGSGSQTPWLLYVVIAVSAVIIVAAVPLLLRARRNALAEPAVTPAKPVTGGANRATTPARPAGEAPTEKLRVFGATSDPVRRSAPANPPSHLPRTTLPAEEIERVWLRVTAAIAAAMGAAMLAVAAASYLMAVDDNNAAWAALAVAAVVTAGMPVIPWLFLRQLHASIAAAR